MYFEFLFGAIAMLDQTSASHEVSKAGESLFSFFLSSSSSRSLDNLSLGRCLGQKHIKMLFVATILCVVISARIGYSQTVPSGTAPSSTSAVAQSSNKPIQVHTISVGKVEMPSFFFIVGAHD